MAGMFLTDHVKSKFRMVKPQGQFGELLLLNFLQHIFRAAPLLRKMSITTNPGLERFGADAIHYRPMGKEHVFYIDESKCYETKYRFNEAFKKSLESILKSYQSGRKG